MPFEGLEPGFDPLVFSPGREGLRKLAFLLRGSMPERFEWDFTITHRQMDCGSVGCAYGLAVTVWPEHMEAGGVCFRPGSRTFLEIMSDAFGVTDSDCRRLFAFSEDGPFLEARGLERRGLPCTPEEVIRRGPTPSQVADVIDHYLATGGFWPV
jgi:hypothetical protein